MLSTVRIEERGLPAAAIVTESFKDLADIMARHHEHPDLHIMVLPYPLDGRPEDELRAIARDFYPALTEMLGVAA